MDFCVVNWENSTFSAINKFGCEGGSFYHHVNKILIQNLFICQGGVTALIKVLHLFYIKKIMNQTFKQKHKLVKLEKHQTYIKR